MQLKLSLSFLCREPVEAEGVAVAELLFGGRVEAGRGTRLRDAGSDNEVVRSEPTVDRDPISDKAVV